MDIDLIRAIAYGTEGELPNRLRPVVDKAWQWGAGRGDRNGNPWASFIEGPTSVTAWWDDAGNRIGRVVRANGTVFTTVTMTNRRELMYEGEYL